MASSKSSGSGNVGIALERMSVEQLKAVKEQTDLEVNLLQDSLSNIRTATTRLEIATTALNDLSLRPQGKKMLVPLTASLYVPASLHDANNVLVDVGTGYFIEVASCYKVLNLGPKYDRNCDRMDHICLSVFEVSKNRNRKKTMAEGKDYCERKINLLKSNFDQLVEVASKKKNVADEVGVILQAKLKQLASST